MNQLSIENLFLSHTLNWMRVQTNIILAELYGYNNKERKINATFFIELILRISSLDNKKLI